MVAEWLEPAACSDGPAALHARFRTISIAIKSSRHTGISFTLHASATGGRASLWQSWGLYAVVYGTLSVLTTCVAIISHFG